MVIAPIEAIEGAARAAPILGDLLTARCGAFVWPLLLCSALVWTIGLASIFGAARSVTIDRLGALSMSIGLLGTVVGMIGAFATGAGGEEMTKYIAVAYWTTGFGLINACTGTVFIILAGRRAEVTA